MRHRRSILVASSLLVCILLATGCERLYGPVTNSLAGPVDLEITEEGSGKVFAVPLGPGQAFWFRDPQSKVTSISVVTSEGQRLFCQLARPRPDGSESLLVTGTAVISTDDFWARSPDRIRNGFASVIAGPCIPTRPEATSLPKTRQIVAPWR